MCPFESTHVIHTMDYSYKHHRNWKLQSGYAVIHLSSETQAQKPFKYMYELNKKKNPLWLLKSKHVVFFLLNLHSMMYHNSRIVKVVINKRQYVLYWPHTGLFDPQLDAMLNDLELTIYNLQPSYFTLLWH